MGLSKYLRSVLESITLPKYDALKSVIVEEQKKGNHIIYYIVFVFHPNFPENDFLYERSEIYDETLFLGKMLGIEHNDLILTFAK